MNTTITKTTKSATRPEGFTKSEWDTKTQRVFNGLVKLAEKQIILPQFTNHPIVKELMERCCGAKTPEARWELTFSLIADSCSYTTKDGQKVLKVKSFGSVRQWFNGGYAEKMARPVSYKEPKIAEKKAKSTKKSTPKKVTNESVAKWASGLTAEQKQVILKALAA